MSSDLNDRKLDILTAVVQTYIATHQPVGSKSISFMLDVPVSSATIRNEMAALTALGYLEQPHTSAGRIPSHRGIRLYIDKLMHAGPATQNDRDLIDAYFNIKDPDPSKLLSESGKVLSYLTNCASLITVSAAKNTAVNKIDVIRVGRRNFLLLLVTSSGMLKSKRCNLEIDMPFEALEFFVRLVNDRFAGIALSSITPKLMQAIAVQLGEYTLMFTPLLFHIYDLAQSAAQNHIYLEGKSNLLSYPEFDSQAKELLAFLENSEELMHVLSLASHHMNILIGREIKRDELSDVGLVITSYHLPDETNGYIGVIGPSGMDYARMIPKVEYFSSALVKLLSEATE